MHLYLTAACFPATNVTIGIVGYEQTEFWREEARHRTRTGHNGETESYTEWETVHYSGHFEILRHAVPCFEFIDGAPVIPGNMRFPFSFVIPDWVPATQKLRMSHESAHLDIEYVFVC